MGWWVDLDMNKVADNLKDNVKWKLYGLTYSLAIGTGVAITFGVALDNIAIGISIGLGSGVSLGAGFLLLLSRRKSC